MPRERELIERFGKRCIRCPPLASCITALALIGGLAGCGSLADKDITGAGGAGGNQMQVPWALPKGGTPYSSLTFSLPGTGEPKVGFGIFSTDPATQTTYWLWEVIVPLAVGSYDLERPGCATTVPSECPVNQNYARFTLGPAQAFGETGRRFTSVRGRVDITSVGADCVVGELQAVLREENESEFNLIGDPQVVALSFRLREGTEPWPPDPPVQCTE